MALEHRPLSRLPQIDASRGLAALLVVLHHCGVHGGVASIPADQAHKWAFYPIQALAYGYIGVDLFLVLSGFCLAYPWLADPKRRFDGWTYLRRRLWRIYRPYLMTVLALFLAGWLVRRATSSTSVFRDLDWAATLRPVEVVGVVTLQMTRLNASFWSLCLEARWYLVFPIALLMARRWTAWPLLAAAFAIVPLLPSGLTGPAKLAVYLPAFVAGVVAAEVIVRPASWRWLHRPDVLAVGLVLSTAALVMLLPGPFSEGRVGWREVAPSTAVFFFLLLCCVRSTATPIVVRPLAQVGWVSYSLYLVHEPLIHTVRAAIAGENWAYPVRLLFWLGAVFPSLVAFGFIAFMGIERPFIRYAARGGHIIASLPVVAQPVLMTDDVASPPECDRDEDYPSAVDRSAPDPAVTALSLHRSLIRARQLRSVPLQSPLRIRQLVVVVRRLAIRLH